MQYYDENNEIEQYYEQGYEEYANTQGQDDEYYHENHGNPFESNENDNAEQ